MGETAVSSLVKRMLWCAAVLAVVACSDPATPPDETEPDPENLVRVVLTPDTMTLVVGQTQKLTAAVSNAGNTAVTYRSSNEAVARVSGTGDITAVGSG